MDLVESKQIYLLFAYLTKDTLISINNNIKYKIVTILKCFPMTWLPGEKGKTIYRMIQNLEENRLLLGKVLFHIGYLSFTAEFAGYLRGFKNSIGF